MSGDAQTRRERSALRRAFTLIEVMIVIAIVLALTGLVGYAVLSRRDEAKLNLAKVDMNMIRGGLKMFRLDFDRYPTEEEGLKVLWDKTALSSEADQNRWKKYMDEPLDKDRWDTPWIYKLDAEESAGEYTLFSAGPDRQEGTEDDVRSGSGSSAGATGATGMMEEAPPLPPASGG
ncbi:MAG: type II secretion system major pseudopilin GspG [Phycisphaerales bacterium]